MAYEINKPPFSLNFQEMSRPDLDSYYTWFMKVLPERVGRLEEAVRETFDYSSWRADKSTDSLSMLGEWFAKQVETRKRSTSEKAGIAAKGSFPVDVPDEELTDKTFSFALDVGMYFSQVILTNLPGTKWEQPLKNVKFADYGQPVIMGFGTVPLNPVRIVVTLAYAISSKTQNGARLRALFDVWAKMKR